MNQSSFGKKNMLRYCEAKIIVHNYFTLIIKSVSHRGEGYPLWNYLCVPGLNK